MMRNAALRTAAVLVSAALSAALLASPTAAQAPQSPPAQPPPASAPGKQTGTLEGSVKKVDPAAGVVQVSAGPLGMFGRTLEVNDDTQINVEGRRGTVADLQQGAKIKAAYEARDGKNIATRIEVVPAQ